MPEIWPDFPTAPHADQLDEATFRFCGKNLSPGDVILPLSAWSYLIGTKNKHLRVACSLQVGDRELTDQCSESIAFAIGAVRHSLEWLGHHKKAQLLLGKDTIRGSGDPIQQDTNTQNIQGNRRCRITMLG